MATLSSCLENFMDRGAWQATVHGATESQTQLKQLSMARQKGSGTSQEKFPPVSELYKGKSTSILKIFCVRYFLIFLYKSLIFPPLKKNLITLPHA